MVAPPPPPRLHQSSVLGAGFGDLGQAKRTQPSAGAQILEQLKGPGLGPLPSSQAAPPVSTQGSNTSIGRLPGLGAPVPPPSSSSWDMKASESNTTSLSSQFSRKCSSRSFVKGPHIMPTHPDSYLSLQAFVAVFMNLQKLSSIFSLVFPASLLKLMLLCLKRILHNVEALPGRRCCCFTSVTSQRAFFSQLYLFGK